MTAPRRSTGRPRSAELDAAILDATIAELNDHGYVDLAIESVARRANTTKPSLYRRWPTRRHLVLDALARGLRRATAPDTGCTLCDLLDATALFVSAFDDLPPNVLGPLLADCAADPDLRSAFMELLFMPPRSAVEDTVRRALDRGDLRRDTDVALAVDLLASLVYYRVLFGHAPLDERDVTGIVDTVLGGIAVDVDALRSAAAATHLRGAAHL